MYLIALHWHKVRYLALKSLEVDEQSAQKTFHVINIILVLHNMQLKLSHVASTYVEGDGQLAQKND